MGFGERADRNPGTIFAAAKGGEWEVCVSPQSVKGTTGRAICGEGGEDDRRQYPSQNPVPFMTERYRKVFRILCLTALETFIRGDI